LLERNGLTKATLVQGKRIYTLTNKGEKTINGVLASSKEIQLFFTTLLGNLIE
jgi:DNA-binding PadR family transcriptional regulator